MVLLGGLRRRRSLRHRVATCADRLNDILQRTGDAARQERNAEQKVADGPTHDLILLPTVCGCNLADNTIAADQATLKVSLILGFAAAIVLFFRPMSFGLAVWLLIGAGRCAFASIRRRGAANAGPAHRTDGDHAEPAVGFHGTDIPV